MLTDTLGAGATEAEEAPVGMLAESAEAEAPSAPQEQAASEEPAQEVQEEQATPSKRRGRPPAKSKKSKGTQVLLRQPSTAVVPLILSCVSWGFRVTGVSDVRRALAFLLERQVLVITAMQLQHFVMASCRCGSSA